MSNNPYQSPLPSPETSEPVTWQRRVRRTGLLVLGIILAVLVGLGSLMLYIRTTNMQRLEKVRGNLEQLRKALDGYQMRLGTEQSGTENTDENGP